MKVKFCGISSVAEAEMAISLNAEYLGFLVGITHLAEDKLTNYEAKKIIDNVDFKTSKPVAVTHLVNAKEVISLLKELNLEVVQLHNSILPEEVLKIKEAIPECYIIKAVHVDGERSIEKAKKMEEFADALILDTRTTERLGGTGITHDWSISRQIVESVNKPVFLAGGLTPNNLQSAINTVHPYGVDVNSGVENPDGKKNFSLMEQFIKIARG